ncbi:hypothetical protein LSCM1_07993 [Leishmania martiniquensis]|uniref:Uncharacterized protein n=1 Tax=Leishmania martiniquensis TaxID=1580590 RepID=A0A836KTK0_9TRYP|nr:hypothetical protein LSCM1_07993 [Leishmania martiniquensis]
MAAASVLSAPAGTPSSLTRLRTCLAIGCGAGLLLYAGVALRRCLACPRPPPQPTCPMADNTIALLRDLHDGPFRFGDPTPFAVAAREEATRRIRRQQRERRRLRRRMRSQLYRAKSYHLPSWPAAKAAAGALAPVSSVLEPASQQGTLSVSASPAARRGPPPQEGHAPNSRCTRSDAATADAARDRRRCAAALSVTDGGLRSTNSMTSFCAVEYDADDDRRQPDGYLEHAFDTVGQLAPASDDARKMTSGEASPTSSSPTSRTYDSVYTYSMSSSSSTTSGSSYGSHLSAPSLTRCVTSSAGSQDGGSSLLAMTTGSATSPDGVAWVKITLDGRGVSGGGLTSAHDAAPPPPPSQHHSYHPPSKDAGGSCGNLSPHMVSTSFSNPQLSSYPHSMTSATAAQGTRRPAQQLCGGTSSSFISIRASAGVPQPGVSTAFSSTFSGDGSRSPDASYATASAPTAGPVPSLPLSGRGGGGEDEEPCRYAASALMYGPPLFATEMDVTGALAELRSSTCGSGERQSNGCIGAGACGTANTAPPPNANATVAGTDGGIKALLSSSINATSFQQQPQPPTHHHHSRGHSRGQGHFLVTSTNTASGSAVLPTCGRHAVHHQGSGSGYNGAPPHASGRRSTNGSPASSQWLPEALPTLQLGCYCDGAPRGWGMWGSEGASGESTVIAANASFTHAPTETPISQASSALRRSITATGPTAHSSGRGNANSNLNHSFRSANPALRHRGGGRLRRWVRRCRRQVRRRVTARCAAVRLCVMHIWLAVRRGARALSGACARGYCRGTRQWRDGASAASAKVLAALRRLPWFSVTPSATAAVDGSCAVAAVVPSSEAAKRRSGHASPGADTTAEAEAEEAKRGGLLATDTADEAIDKIVQLLEPTPGRVPTVVVIRAPLGYDVSTDAASLWKALHLDSTSSEEGLIDIVIMEELKTGPLPPAQVKAAATAAGPSSQAASGPEKPATSCLPQQPQPQGPFTSVAAAATATARAPAQLRISFEVYPAHLFYSFVIRAAVLQEKDWALRRAAAELFGGSAEVTDGGGGLGASTAATGTAGGVPAGGSPLSFTFGATAPSGECSSGSCSSAMTSHPSHGTAAGAGSGVGFENFCLSPLSPGHFCRAQVFLKPTAPAPHAGLAGGAGVGAAGVSSGTAGDASASPVKSPASVLSPVTAATASPQVVVRLSESYSFPALPPQMVMSPLLGSQSRLGAPLGALPAGLNSSVYGGGGGALAGAGSATGASGSTVVGAAAAPGPARRIISDNELLFYIHVLRTTVGDGVATTALPSSQDSEACDDNAGKESTDAAPTNVQRGPGTAANRSLPAPNGTSDADPIDRSISDVEEDSGDDSEDPTLLDLRQREIEPQVLLRYRFRVFQQGSRSRKALDAAVLYTQDHVEQWHEEAKAMLQALPATASYQAHSSLSTPSLQVKGSSPALRSPESVGWMAPFGGGGDAPTGTASARPPRRSCPRPAGLPLLSLRAEALASTPELDQVDCRTPAVNCGSVQLPAWAMEVLVRRESMRETLVRDLKEKAFRVCAIPLPDMRVHCILPPAVPRYATAHARGFPLSRTFAEEVLSQQRALQFILLQREQENQRIIAARIRHEQRRQERRERKRRERRAREEAWRRAQQERQQRKNPPQKRNVTSAPRESGERLKEWLAGTMNPATLVSRVTSMIKHVSAGNTGGGEREVGSVCTHEPPQCGDSVCKACMKVSAAYRQGAGAGLPLGASSVTTPPPPQYRHGYPAANGSLCGASSPVQLHGAAPECSMRDDADVSQEAGHHVGCGEVALSDSVGNALQQKRLRDEPSSHAQVHLALLPAERDVDMAVDASSRSWLTPRTAGLSDPSCAVAVGSHSNGCDAGGSGDRGACALAGAPSPSPTSPRPHTVTASIMPPTLPNGMRASPPPQSHWPASGSGSPKGPPPPSHLSQSDHSGGRGSGGAARPVSVTSASSARSSQWTAVHTATNANSCVTPPAPSGGGSPEMQANCGGNSSVSASTAVSHGSPQMTPTSVSSPQNHFGTLSSTAPAIAVMTSSPVSLTGNTTPSTCIAGATGLHYRTTSTPNCSFPSMPLPPPPPPLAERSSPSPPPLVSGTSSSSCIVPVPDAAAAALATTCTASFGASAGDHHHARSPLMSQQSHSRQLHRSLQNPALPATATSLLDVEDALRLSASGNAVQSDTSSHHHQESLALPENGGMASASPTPAPLAVPNNSMYGTFDAYYGHSVVTPQAVMLRQQAQAAAASIASSSMRVSTPPRHRAAESSFVMSPAAITLAEERGTRKGGLHKGDGAGDRDGRWPTGTRSNTASPPAAGTLAAADAAAQQWQPPSQQHLQAVRSVPRRIASGLLPYTYSADSVSSLYGTTHYPLYQYPDDPDGFAAAGYTGVSPPTAAMGSGGGGASATALAGFSHTGAPGLYAYNPAGYSGNHLFGASATGLLQASTPAGNSTALSCGGVGGDRRPGSSVGGVGRVENRNSLSQSPRAMDSPMEVNAGPTAPRSLPPVQDTLMNRLKQYNKLLSDLLGVAGGPMRSGISFYYTYGDATALLYNASIRVPCDENILDLLDHHQWVRKQQLLHSDGGGGGASSDSGGAADGRVPSGEKTVTGNSSGSTLSSSGADRSSASRVPASLASIGASPPPPPPCGSGSAGRRDTNADHEGERGGCEAFSTACDAATPAAEDEGCSYLEYGDLAGLQDTMDTLEAEQMEAQRARNTRFYSIFEHLHHVYHDIVLEAAGSGSAGASPATPAAATGSLNVGLTGGVGMEYFSSTAAAAGTAGAERHTVSPHGIALATLPGSGTPRSGVLLGGKGAADATHLPRGCQRLWSRVCALVAWAGSLVGFARQSLGDSIAAGVATDAGGVGTCWSSSQRTADGARCAFDPAKLAAYFPGERIVTFGSEWCLASRLDLLNGHFGLSPLQVWMAARYSRRFAGEVYLMDVVAAGSDPYYPAVRVLDEVVAHAVLYYHNHSLRDFVEDVAAELGLVYVPQTQWGRRALGLPDQEAEVQELDGLLHTATRRRQRAQGGRPQRCRSRDGRGTAFRKGYAMTAGGCQERHRSSSAQAARDNSATTQRSGSGGGDASDSLPALRSLASDGDQTPSMAAAAAATTRRSRPPPLQQHYRPRRLDRDRLEDEMAEHRWRLLQDRDQEEDEEVFYGATAAAAAGLGGGDIIAPHVYDSVLEREVYDERMLLRELDHLKDFLVDNRNVLSSAMLTTAGSNSLEAVFGVPATVFPFLLCARESVPFVASIFESLSYHYGSLTYDSFSKYTYDVYHCDRPEVLRHTPRMFRMVNKSRRGCITYEELCRWMARKLSCGNNIRPNGHLVATSMSLRLPLALVAESRDEWDAYRCALKSLSDCDDEEY